MLSLDCLVVQHVPFEGPGRIAEWMEDRGHTVSTLHIYNGEPLPAPEQFDWVVLMGGPMSVNDTDTCPWLEDEIIWVKQLIETRRRLLGICLGAQLIARALGSRVYPAREKEIGWYPVSVHGAVPVALPESLEVLHWHGETFDLPPGAQRWASSPVCPNQAFGYNRRVMALQFHLEATQESLTALVDNAGDEIGHGRYQMPQREILSRFDDGYTFRTIHLHLESLLAYLEGQPID
ncbi:MAG: type 1 glutamine amidotransferase [Alkalispirochaetaceae bacterium]